MREITKDILCRYLEEIGYDARTNGNGDYYVMKYADEVFPHDIEITYIVDGEWILVRGTALRFGPPEGDEYVVMEVLNEMNKKRSDPVGFYLNFMPRFQYRVKLGQEVSEAYIKRDVIQFGAYCIVSSFEELGLRLNARGIETVSPF